MRRLVPILILAACSSEPERTTVDSNVRMPGEPSTVARTLTPAEESEVLDAMASAQTAQERAEARPLEPAGADGRWREVATVAGVAVKRCQTAILDQQAIDGGWRFMLINIHDEPGELVVHGNDAEGVTEVTASVGMFGERTSRAEDLVRSFRQTLQEYARVRRPQ
ncbi:MAG: hypothetical protein RLZZ558_213 [Planctomycetota bacterium]